MKIIIVVRLYAQETVRGKVRQEIRTEILKNETSKYYKCEIVFLHYRSEFLYFSTMENINIVFYIFSLEAIGNPLFCDYRLLWNHRFRIKLWLLNSHNFHEVCKWKLLKVFE